MTSLSFVRPMLAVLCAATMLTPLAAHARGGGGGRDSGGARDLSAYVELDQVVFADLKGDKEVLTYSSVAVGGDVMVAKGRVQGQVSLRYERIIGYGDRINSRDMVSGLASAAMAVSPALSIEGGAMAARGRVDARGAAPTNMVGNQDNVSQVYSVYAGPSLATRAGALAVNASYRIGYTKVEDQRVESIPYRAGQADMFDDSVSHSASASVSMQPGDALPFGWTVGVGWDREDSGHLDQRFEGQYARADIIMPVSPTVALLAGAGYEDIEISEKDALRDGAGRPVIGDDGRLVTDGDSPRLLSYDEEGLYWDVGVMWRPSRRTTLEARVGERYDSLTYYGSFHYQPSARTAVNVSVYDTVSGLGRSLNERLAGLGTRFSSRRNPLSGDLAGCAIGEGEGSGSGGGGSLCLNDALFNAPSAAFRSRGVTGTITSRIGMWEAGLAAGYARRKYLVSRAGARAGLDGSVDENYFLALSAGTSLDALSTFDTGVYASYILPGQGEGDVIAVGANAAYNRYIWRGLEATAAVGIDSYRQQGFDSDLTASALLGLRYNF